MWIDDGFVLGGGGGDSFALLLGDKILGKVLGDSTLRCCCCCCCGATVATGTAEVLELLSCAAAPRPRVSPRRAKDDDVDAADPDDDSDVLRL